MTSGGKSGMSLRHKVYMHMLCILERFFCILRALRWDMATIAALNQEVQSATINFLFPN